MTKHHQKKLYKKIRRRLISMIVNDMYLSRTGHESKLVAYLLYTE